MGRNGTRRHRFTASGFFVLRTPLLSFDEFAAWGSGLEAATCDGDDVAVSAALDRDRQRLRARLADVTAEPRFRDALFVASPALDAGAEVWRRDPDSERGRKSEQPLVAYFSRAAARPTPFGLFAGCTTGAVGPRTSLGLGDRAGYQRHSRLDMEYLCALAEAIQRDPELRSELVFRPNSSLYEAGGRLHVVEASQAPGRRAYKLVAIDKTPYLEATLQRASAGAELDDLAAALVDDEITDADARAYLGELVESQLLVADVEPQLTGQQPVERLLPTLAAHPSTQQLAHRLEHAARELASIDEDGVGATRDRYQALASSLTELPAEPQLARLVQVDLTKPNDELALGENIVTEVAAAVELLHALAPRPQRDALARFRDEFTRRYETREVPLVEVLDAEHGIGFELIDPAAPDQRASADGSADRDRMLLRKFADALANGAEEVTIDDRDAAAAKLAEPRPLPEGFEVVAALEASSSTALEAGDFRVFVQSVAGPPGGRLTARFCHADALLHEYVAAQVRAEEATRPDCVFAEIVHLPEDRVGNILSRPLLREYEIPYLGVSAAPPERQLPVTDLLVSVDMDRIVLRSRRLDCEVLPRLTTAHNFTFSTLPVYRFLAALQHEGVLPALMWDWGVLSTAPFLPRVVSGRAVLSRMRWNLDAAELATLSAPSAPEAFAAIRVFRQRRRLPRFVALADGDNELVVDLDNILLLEALARELKGRDAATLVELFPAPDRLCVDGPEGRFTHQFVLPFLNPQATRDAPPAARESSDCKRRFAPGSEWLYLKLFSGSATADLILERLTPGVHAAIASGVADAWFFIRYGDPDWHLRLRVHGDPGGLLAQTLPQLTELAQPLLDSGELWRVQVDTYEREVERYGGACGIELAERIFSADSDAAVAVLRMCEREDSELRSQAALAGIYCLFDEFKLTLEEKRSLVQRACGGYGGEFGVTKEFHGEMSRRYRRERDAIARLIYAEDEHAAAFLAPLRIRAAAIAPLVREFRALANAGQLTQPLHDIVLSFAHMHVNRLLRSAQRAHELVVYEMLSRVYSAEAARPGVARR